MKIKGVGMGRNESGGFLSRFEDPCLPRVLLITQPMSMDQDRSVALGSVPKGRGCVCHASGGR
jgi:hypothetical protein